MTLALQNIKKIDQPFNFHYTQTCVNGYHCSQPSVLKVNILWSQKFIIRPKWSYQAATFLQMSFSSDLIFLATYYHFDCISFWQKNVKRNKSNIIFLYKESDLFPKHCPPCWVICGHWLKNLPLGTHIPNMKLQPIPTNKIRLELDVHYLYFCFYRDLNSSYSNLSNISLDGLMEKLLQSYYGVHW